MGLKLLHDALEFWPAVAADIATARESVFVQALTFEGDAAGRGLAEALLRSPARDRRVLVDSFSKFVVSDRFLAAPRNLADRALRREARDTRVMWSALAWSGAPVHFTSPVGPFFVRFPARDHKKLVLVDDRIAYVGGINFSDHNFAWRDLMLRVEKEDVARFLREDFLRTWEGRARGSRGRFDGIELHCLDGHTNEAGFEAVLSLLDCAHDQVYMECAYVTSPFVERLRAASARGVRVTVVTPDVNNWKAIRAHLAWQAARSSIEVRFYRGRMTHMKALLVDDTTLVLGSANFDLWSYRYQREYLAVVTDPAPIADFRARTVAEGLRGSHRAPSRGCWLPGRLAALELRWLERIARVLPTKTRRRRWRHASGC